eukprot:CAMPEP_0181194976 /NCGR_PEP_ID=MMETSP1096-20121128/14628_1 /TAXON_ID=156174 ORGANISM="Chrysochromulina ericina, Strain CCMP281" /NCGR_SAMPLE_ID=MMETSP1096 /ASSEMBLY_ACC=CAM_ASM_000453 /LENGTH=126 /DNA_ID=CAMNT_0023284523 /DNA_START=511 /DNA_END=888 /DNA_ORIENTATION=+
MAVASVELVELEILAVDKMHRPLAEVEPNDTLLSLKTNNPRLVEGGDNSRVVLGSEVTNNRLTAPEDVRGLQFLLLLHTGCHVGVVDDDALGQLAQAAHRGDAKLPARKRGDPEHGSCSVCLEVFL